MIGASREAVEAARERLDALTDNTRVDAADLASDLAAVTALLDRETALRRLLTDPAQSGERKAELVGRLLTGQVSGEAVDLVSGMVRSRWTASRNLVDAVEQLAEAADLIAADEAGALDTVEDELFRFGRIVATSPALSAALSAKDTDSARIAARAGLIRELLGGRAHEVTIRLVTRLVERPRGRSLDSGLDALCSLAAARRGRSVAVVTSAVPLSDAQRQRLGDTLTRLYGRPIQLNLDVDPAVIGGISVRVGDEIIHGTIADRLDEVNRRMAG
ncbi:F0F1 ATP synthase subunit delta [Streptomyces mayteni]